MAGEIKMLRSSEFNKESTSSKDSAEVLEHNTSPKRCLGNLFINSFSYFLFFTGFWSLSNLQSTMNAEQGMGPSTQAVLYFSAMVSCFFPKLMIERFGAKSTFMIALLAMCPYIAANFYLRWDLMTTASIIYGLANGPFMAAKATYIDEMATRYTASVGGNLESTMALFFGIHEVFVESNQVLGSTISYFVLDRYNSNRWTYNVSMHEQCGINFTLGEEHKNCNLLPPSQRERNLLIGVYLLLGLSAVVIASFMDPLKNDIRKVRGFGPVLQTFFGAVSLMKNPDLLLLIPLSISCGIKYVFYSNEFTQAYIACSWGVHHVGFVTICFGVCGALMAIFVGPLVKCISQMSVILLAATLNFITYILLFLWKPSPEVPLAYFAFAGVWGMTDAIWWSQIAALYGLMFPNDREAAFSNFFFWSFLGYFLSYSYANYFTVAVKIYIMLGFLIVGITLYLIGQIKIKCFSPRSDYMAIEDS